VGKVPGFSRPSVFEGICWDFFVPDLFVLGLWRRDVFRKIYNLRGDGCFSLTNLMVSRLYYGLALNERFVVSPQTSLFLVSLCLTFFLCAFNGRFSPFFFFLLNCAIFFSVTPIPSEISFFVSGFPTVVFAVR